MGVGIPRESPNYKNITRKGEKIMTITREDLIRMLSEKSGYWQKDIRAVLQCMDEVVFDALCNVTDDEDVSVQIIKGAKLSTHVVPARDRVDPRNGQPIVCKPTVKPSCKFSQDMRVKLQESYDNKKNG